MPPAGFELTISAGGRPQTYALDRVATGIGRQPYFRSKHVCGILYWYKYDFVT